jgi:hypothetical protein
MDGKAARVAETEAGAEGIKIATGAVQDREGCIKKEELRRKKGREFGFRNAERKLMIDRPNERQTARRICSQFLRILS